MLKIRCFEESDKQESISLLQAIFPKKKVDNFGEFWEWQYLCNPKNMGANPAILLSELVHKIVGILAGIETKFKFGNSVLDCLWLTDYGTYPDYRFKAGAFKLAHRAMKDFDILLGFGNPQADLRPLLGDSYSAGGSMQIGASLRLINQNLSNIILTTSLDPAGNNSALLIRNANV
jgi:hypothetical protein